MTLQNTPLDRGKRVAFEVTVEYELASKGMAFIRVSAVDEKRKTVAELSRAQPAQPPDRVSIGGSEGMRSAFEADH